MKRISAIFVTFLMISFSLNAMTDCNMSESSDMCSDMLHIKAEPSRDMVNCCSITTMEYEKDLSNVQQMEFAHVFDVNSSSILLNKQEIDLKISIYMLSFAYPPPLETIKFLC